MMIGAGSTNLPSLLGDMAGKVSVLGIENLSTIFNFSDVAGAGVWGTLGYSIVDQMGLATQQTQSILGTPSLLEAFGF